MPGVLVDTDQLDRSGWDAVGSALEAGLEIGLGALPTERPGRRRPDQVARRAMAPCATWRSTPTRSGQLIITPACGLAGATADDGGPRPAHGADRRRHRDRTVSVLSRTCLLTGGVRAQ